MREGNERGGREEKEKGEGAEGDRRKGRGREGALALTETVVLSATNRVWCIT